ncbi:hypothetical protein MPER_02267 [Moniliophthora perniciosa FA553]|nr:hypothetical protein MPER_02267 [Moniliophthora perniciosa FA553]
MRTSQGIWSDAQIKAWKEVTDSVHSKGFFIYLQLWAIGRAAKPDQLRSEDPSYPFVSASDIPMEDGHEAPPAKNAVERAGFDGVEIHGANGYLVDQFTQDVSNRRTDEYGGSIENRSRFALEVLDAVVKAVGPRKTGIRLSPWSKWQGMGMQNPKPQFAHFVTEIKKAHSTLGHIHVVEPRIDGVTTSSDELPKGCNNDFIREIWTLSPGGNDTEDGRRFISAGNHEKSGAQFADKNGDLVAYGRRFISNPDLPYKLLHDIALTP